MRSFILALAGLSSCSILVGKINPCINGKNEPDSFCFETQPSIKLAGTISEMKAGDINADGLTDIVAVVNEGDQSGSFVHILFQEEGGQFRDEPLNTTGSVTSFDVADSQQDPTHRQDDIVIVDGVSLTLVRALDGGLLIDSQPFSDLGAGGLSPRVGAFGRFSPDTDLEVAVAFITTGQGVIHNFSTFGGQLHPSEFSTQNNPIPVVTALVDFQVRDIDGDSDDEYAVLIDNNNFRQLALYINEDPFNQPPNIVDIGTTGEHITIANLDNDRELELVFNGGNQGNRPTANISQIVAGTPPFIDPAPTFLLAAYQTSTAGDVDGDGILDVLLINTQNQVEIARQETPGQFAPTNKRLTLSQENGDGFRGAALAVDLNQDGVADILVADGTNQIEVFFSDP